MQIKREKDFGPYIFVEEGDTAKGVLELARLGGATVSRDNYRLQFPADAESQNYTEAEIRHRFS